MIQLLTSPAERPNRIETPEVLKGEEYHLRYARWAVWTGSSTKHSKYVNDYDTNLKFYKDDQWCMDEDLDAFFKDEAGNDRNRLKVTRNYVQPMVEQYRGNAERMTFDMKAINISPLAKSRRDKALARALSYNHIARTLPGYESHLQESNVPIGNDTQVTDVFNNLYVDNYTIALNRILKHGKDVNRFDEAKSLYARDLALAGVAIAKPYPHGGEWMFKRVSPDRFGWDRNAQDPTLRDAEYFFEQDIIPTPSIFELYQHIPHNVRKAIEQQATSVVGSTASIGNKFFSLGRTPVYTSVWKDIIYEKYGYVMDEYGQRILVRIDYIEPNQTEPKYKEKDLIPLEKLTEYQKKVLKGGNTAYLYVDHWRYCTFIPGEVIPVKDARGRIMDVALDYGVIPYQEPDLYKPTNMVPPYKVGIWSYIDGEVLSPVSVVINPQRMINRFLSVMENHINNSGGSGVVYDKDLTGTSQEDDIKAAVSRGEAIGVHAKGRGVNNVFGRYDSTVKESIVAFSSLIENFKLGIEQVTGVNEGVKGETNNPDQLVGVMQLMIQRGLIIQEPFYKALSDLYQGCYQSIASSGRRYYIDNEVELMDIVGEDMSSVIKLSKDMRNESMRVTVVRNMDRDNERVMVDSNVMTWLQFGLVDQELASKLVGRATMEEALFHMRDFQKQLAVLKRKQQQAAGQVAQQQANATEQAGRVAYGEKLREEMREDFNRAADRGVQLASTTSAQ